MVIAAARTPRPRMNHAMTMFLVLIIVCQRIIPGMIAHAKSAKMVVHAKAYPTVSTTAPGKQYPGVSGWCQCVQIAE